MCAAQGRGKHKLRAGRALTSRMGDPGAPGDELGAGAQHVRDGLGGELHAGDRSVRSFAGVRTPYPPLRSCFRRCVTVLRNPWRPFWDGGPLRLGRDCVGADCHGSPCWFL